MGKLVWLKYDLLWFLTWIPWRTNALYCSWFHWNFCSGYLKNHLKTSKHIFCDPLINSSFLPVFLFQFQFENRVPTTLCQSETYSWPSSQLVYNVNFKKYSPINSPYSCVQLTTLTRFRWTIWDNRTFDYNKVTGFN